MKRKLLIIIFLNCILVVFVVFKTVVIARPEDVSKELTQALSESGCTTKPSREEVLLTSKYSQIRRLGELDAKCKSNSSELLVYQFVIPRSDSSAKELALRTSQLILESNNFDVTPIILLSPDKDWKLLDIRNLVVGNYDPYTATFFKELRLLGVTDDASVKWVLLPSANLPYWDKSYIAPADFIAIYNRIATQMFASYKNPEVGIILNSHTHETYPFKWTDREYVPFDAYLTGINKKYVGFFGIESVPWMPSLKTKDDLLFTPHDYLNLNNLSGAAQLLGTKNIYILTGTFSTAYTAEPDKTTKVPAQIRKVLLEETLDEVSSIKIKDSSINLLIIAQDLSSKEEQTDWSYWGSTSSENPNHETALLDFLRQAKTKAINVGFIF